MIFMLHLDNISVFIFALTGALVASRAQLDIVGFIFVACLTAVGGGTIRDLLLGRDVFWISDPRPVAIAAIAAVIVFFTAHLLESRLRAVFWLDALALAVAVPAGVAVALAMGAHWSIVMIMGISTGCFGGLMRDVVCNEVPLVLKQGELYVTCAFVGAATASTLVAVGQSWGIALLACGIVTFALRAGSIAFGWRLPNYRHEPPKQ